MKKKFFIPFIHDQWNLIGKLIYLYRLSVVIEKKQLINDSDFHVYKRISKESQAHAAICKLF